MDVRKLQKVGNRSYSLCLPKTWVKSQNLKEKDSVFLEVNRKNELVLKTNDKTSRRPSHVQADVSGIEDITEFLVFCYVRNVDMITLKTAGSDYKTISSIKKTLKYLDGYDITSEDENKIVISFLFKEVNVNLDNIRRRILYLLPHMLESLEKNDMESLNEIETNIDRLYHLSKRIMFSCIGNAQLKEENGLKSDEDLFFMNLIYKKLENIADSIYSLRDLSVTEDDIKDIKTMLGLVNDLFNKRGGTRHTKTAIKGIMERHTKAKDVASATIHKIADLCMDVTENTISLRFDLDYFNKNER